MDTDTGNKHRQARTAIASVVAAALLTALPGTALAAPDDLSSATLKLELQNRGGLKLKPKSLTLSMRKGALDPTNGEGTFKVSGGFRAKQNGGKARVKFFSLALAPNGGTGSLGADVGKKELENFANVTGGTLTRDGWGARLEGATVRLTKKGAKTLRKRLNGSASKAGKAVATAAKLKKGQELGKLSVAGVPKTVEVLPGSGNMTLVPSMAVGSLTTKLPGHCILPVPGMGPPTNGVYAVAPATQAVTGEFTFPVSGGEVAPDFTDGNVITAGGQNVAKNSAAVPLACVGAPPVGTTVVQTELQTQFATKALAANTTLPAGNIGVAGLGAIDFSTATMSADPATRQISFTGATVRLDPVAAFVLNGIFPNQSGLPSEDFAGGDEIGTLSLTATTH